MASQSLLRLLSSLANRHREGAEILWEQGKDQYFVSLGSVLFEIKEEDVGTHPTPIRVAVTTIQNSRLADEVITAADPAYETVAFLMSSAKDRFVDADALLEACAEAVDTSVGPIGVSPPPPPLPSGPTPEQEMTFLAKISGDWNLDYTTGKESLSIDPDGKYFLRKDRHGRPISRTIKPVFQLRLVACNDSLSRVEIAKEQPDGRVRQIEALTVSDEEMIGYAKHDGHKLRYVRSN